MFADLVLLNGKIVTVDAVESIREAVAIKFGRFIEVGGNADVQPLIGKDTKVVDLRGRTVIPGLIDSHCHMLDTGAGIMAGEVDLSEEGGVRSIGDIKAKISEKAASTPLGEWIIGVKEDDSKLRDMRHPTRWDLDEAAPDHPVMISTVGGHYSIVNSKAFEKAGVSRDTPDPEGGVFERDPRSRELTGGVHEKARLIVYPEDLLGKAPTKQQSLEGARHILRMNAESGLTCIYDMVDSSNIRAVIDLKNSNDLPIRVRMDARIELFPELNRLGIVQLMGDDWVKLCGLKTFLDGAISARTAVVSEPYLNRPDFYGVMATTKEMARRTILEAYAEGYRVSIHANGDTAINMCLDIMEEAQEKYPRADPRNRIIHCSVVNEEIVDRIKRLDMLPTIFGAYAYYHGDKILPAFGESRIERMFAARWFLDAGIKVAAHSDHSASPFPPLMGIHSLVNRKTRTGKPAGIRQRTSVMEALKLYTINAAYQSFDENDLGSIEVGKLADLVVLGRDLLTEPEVSIIDIPIDMTIVGGNVIHERK